MFVVKEEKNLKVERWIYDEENKEFNIIIFFIFYKILETCQSEIQM